MDARPGPDRSPRRGRTRPWAALLLLVVLLVALAAWLSRPAQVAGLVLRQAGAALGLEIGFDGAAEYRLRGVPHLMVRGLDVRRPGSDAALLTARRAFLALPWSTLRSRGADLTVERVELDAPVLDLAELQAWLATRPPGDGPRVPTLTGGVRVTGGAVEGGDWRVDRIGVDVPFLAPGRPVRGRVFGELAMGTTRLPFHVHLTLAEPARDAAVGVAGNATLVTDSWSLGMQPVLSARLHAGTDGLGLDDMRLGMRGRHVAPERDALRFTAGLAAPLRYRDGRLAVTPAALVVRGDGTVPDLRARGGFAWEGDAALDLEGALQQWPRAWPALPEPLAGVSTPLPFALAYTGPADLSGPTRLRLEHGPARLDAGLRLPEVLGWLDRQPGGTPLPPLQGRLAMPRLELAGATLHGVEVEMSPETDAP